jgi:hypothetical protein
MTTESRKLTDDYLGFAEEEFKAGNLTPEVYYKALLQIAAEYLTEHNDEEASLRTVCKVDPDFIRNDLPRHLRDDGLLGATMVEFAYHLERRGITWEGFIAPTQAEAQA